MKAELVGVAGKPVEALAQSLALQKALALIIAPVAFVELTGNPNPAPHPADMTQEGVLALAPNAWLAWAGLEFAALLANY